jgi:multidrug efflux pump subunit AcrB
MTSVVAVLGALPIAFSIGSGSKSRIGLGVVIIGGLTFSLLLTLFIIPAMYLLISKKRKKHINISNQNDIVSAESSTTLAKV